MADIAIITDSTAYIPKELVDTYDIKVAPQVLIWGDESFLDGVDIQPAEFYERLSTSSVMPTTSQATVAAFHSIFEPLAEAGTPMVVIVISEKLSGTLQSARQAKEMFQGATIELVDSRSTSMELEWFASPGRPPITPGSISWLTRSSSCIEVAGSGALPGLSEPR